MVLIELMNTDTHEPDAPTPDRWRLTGGGIMWNVTEDARLPHTDHIEMSGRHVSVIIRYTVDADRRLTLTKEVIWPTLRTKEGDVRGYLCRTYSKETEPQLLINEKPSLLLSVESITLVGGVLWINYKDVKGHDVSRRIGLNPATPAIVDMWIVGTPHNAPGMDARWRSNGAVEQEQGVYGTYQIRVDTKFTSMPARLPYRSTHTAEVIFGATLAGQNCELHHNDFYRWCLQDERDDLQLSTPDPVLNRAFEFAKFRAAESLFETKMGLVHSPGGGRYYGGIWTNDQAEYSGPLFGYLGEPDADRAALTAYRNFMPYMTDDYRKNIPSSLEMEGTIEIHAGGDRGDAAMYAGGAARYALSRGDRKIAEELYPAVQWCLEYCRRKTNADGVVTSDTDELEGRFPTGDANLSTSCLTFDGLRRGADLAHALGYEDDAREYLSRAVDLEAAIEAHFGAQVEGFHTYRYYDGNTTLRAWICLPLCFGINSRNHERVNGTLDALFSPRLWTPDGLATEAGDTVYWDRATLYALRGAFFAGATDTALSYLTAYSRRCLLGDHVPYPVEAYPEGDGAHLSAESALYCRVFTEGIFGHVPTGLDSFSLAPRLPSAWPEMTLTLPAAGDLLTIRVTRAECGQRLETRITNRAHTEVLTATHDVGATVEVRL